MANNKTVRVGASLALVVVISLFLSSQIVQAQTQGRPLQLRSVQVLNAYQNRVCQHVYENGSYRMAWQSAPLEGNPSVRLGDIDNDGQNEIVASVYYYTRTAGKKPNRLLQFSDTCF